MREPQERPDQPFSDAALSEAAAVAQRMEALLEGRPTVQGITIDTPTSKDLDDAFWLEKTAQGDYQFLISITDVGSLIHPQITPQLNATAQRRSFTRYYADHNYPMLPAIISENLLSLLEGHTRPTITLSIALDAELHLGASHISQTALSSSRRLSYKEVDAEIEQPPMERVPMLHLAYDLAQRLLQGRKTSGALAFYDIVAGWATTEDGFLRPLGEDERYKTQIITQEFMILANQVFAHFFATRGILALYRNHKANAIAPERATLLQMMETSVAYPEHFNPERVRATVNLAMERAKYAPIVEGHFGLNLPAYIHLTSPLRRYSDLLNQWILLAALKGETIPLTKTELDEIAVSINEEENAMKEAKKQHFLAVYDQQIEEMAGGTTLSDTIPSTPLEQLDTKKFHSVIRIAAQRDTLLPAIEEEILRRLEGQHLNAHDLFTLLFRYANRGEEWAKVQQASLQALQKQPHDAISILWMGRQSLGWGEPLYTFTSQGADNAKIFQANVTISVAKRDYTSSLHTAIQKECAKQFASVEILAKIAEGEQGSLSLPSPDGTSTQNPIVFPFVFVHEQELSEAGSDKLQNYKGHLQELAQAQKWEPPVYREEEETGPPHALTFTMKGEICIENREYSATGKGNTKIRAEQNAAYQLLQLVPQQTSSVASKTKSAVSILNEMKQKAEILSVAYTYDPIGPQHQRTFLCDCAIVALNGREIRMTGEGQTKKEAAQVAALQAIAILSREMF